MDNGNMGTVICKLRKEKGMTQQELADKLQITDKAVSKWERGLACPDISILPHVAEILGVSTDDLISTKIIPKDNWHSFKELDKNDFKDIFFTICRCSSMALAIGGLIFNISDKLNTADLFTLLCTALILLGISTFKGK